METGRDSGIELIKVSGRSRPSAVAGAIAYMVRERNQAVVQAIGASAIHQTIKALVVAKIFLANDGFEIVCIPEFVDVQIEDKIRTAVKFIIEPR